MNIIITGASKGIGFEAVKLFSQVKENKILCISRSGYIGENKNGNIISIKFDLQKGNVEKELIPEIKKHFSQLDILINNVGMLVNKPFEQLSDEDWINTFETNLFSVVRLVKYSLPLMGKNARSHIVNISSIGGFQGSSKFAGLSSYSASKAALVNLTECLAEELKEKNISVNCLCLGATQTEMFSKAFPGFNAPVNASTMAEYVVWFATNAHKTMNGKIIPVSLSTP